MSTDRLRSIILSGVLLMPAFSGCGNPDCPEEVRAELIEELDVAYCTWLDALDFMDAGVIRSAEAQLRETVEKARPCIEVDSAVWILTDSVGSTYTELRPDPDALNRSARMCRRIEKELGI